MNSLADMPILSRNTRAAARLYQTEAKMRRTGDPTLITAAWEDPTRKGVVIVHTADDLCHPVTAASYQAARAKRYPKAGEPLALLVLSECVLVDRRVVDGGSADEDLR